MTVHANTCPAFYLDATIDPVGSYSPCTALGGGAFRFDQQPFKTIWLSSELESARQQSAEGKKLDMCQRCWSEEKLGFTSERQYLIADVALGLNYTDVDYYYPGPKHLNIKVSNICNLRCRTCQSKDSYLYHIEGEYYEKKNNITQTAYTLEKFKKSFTNDQLDELFECSKNLERIELYGGEPFLDNQIPKLLLKLIETGFSQHIDLSVSTNATHKLTDTWRKILTSFREVMLNVSIDGIGDKFTYMRHPGDWTVVERNLKDFFQLEYASKTLTIKPVITVSALNVWHVPEVFDYFTRYNIEPFIILVQWPKYYCVNVYPESVRSKIAQHLKDTGNVAFDPIINLMNTAPNVMDKSLGKTPWEEFKFWTKEKDEYRKESFVETFSDVGNILVEQSLW